MTPRPSLPPDQLTKLLHLGRTTTLSTRVLGRRFGIDHGTVARKFRKYGVVRPSHHTTGFAIKEGNDGH